MNDDEFIKKEDILLIYNYLNSKKTYLLIFSQIKIEL